MSRSSTDSEAGEKGPKGLSVDDKYLVCFNETKKLSEDTQPPTGNMGWTRRRRQPTKLELKAQMGSQYILRPDVGVTVLSAVGDTSNRPIRFLCTDILNDDLPSNQYNSRRSSYRNTSGINTHTINFLSWILFRRFFIVPAVRSLWPGQDHSAGRSVQYHVHGLLRIRAEHNPTHDLSGTFWSRSKLCARYLGKWFRNIVW